MCPATVSSLRRRRARRCAARTRRARAPFALPAHVSVYYHIITCGQSQQAFLPMLHKNRGILAAVFNGLRIGKCCINT